MAPLIGRDSEVRAVVGLVDTVGERGGALVVSGEAGVGKSSLLAAAEAGARGRGARVLETTGVESEAHLPFAGLHRLLHPVLGGVDGLPGPQRDAVRAAFGLSEGPAPDPFLIALAALHLLSDASARRPVVVVVDDAQWLDRPTADVLTFVARRLESDRVVLLAAVRDRPGAALLEAGLPELRLEPLGPEAAAALLDGCAPGLSVAVRARVLDDAAGNPLALVELPVALRSAGVEGGAEPPGLLPLTARLERAFAARVSELPAATRTLLHVAAVDVAGDLPQLLRAAAAIGGEGVTTAAVTPAVTAGLVEVGETGLRFRHPLVRSAVHQTASFAERQAAHAALAAVLTDDPDRRVWHRAASVVAPDEDVAAELEAAARRAQRRGAVPVAVAALERAAQLSGDPVGKGGRLLRAAEVAFELGQYGDVVRLLREVEPLDLDPLDLPRLAWLREVLEGGVWTGAARVRTFVAIADRLALGGDHARALHALLSVALRCWFSNPDPETRALLVESAERVPVADDHPALLAVLAWGGPVERGAVVVDRLSRLVADTERNPEALRLLGAAATAVGAFDQAARFLEASVAGLRAQGRLGLLAQALVSQALTGLVVGRWDAGRLAAEEAGRLAHETAQPLWVAVAHLVEGTIAAYRGDSEGAGALAADAERVLLPMSADPMLSLVQHARGAAALADGRHADAYDHLRRVFDPEDTPYHPHVRSWVLVDLVEAAVHGGRPDEARAFVEDLEPVAERTRSPLLRVSLRYARPVLAGDDEAEPLFRAGLGADLAGWPFQQARLQLAYGVWLRRQRRAVDSRGPLRAARDAFDALGAVPWGERARQELRAAGETSRTRTPGAGDHLSPQELQIAQMAAAGLSNKEIGAQLYLSHRTVGTHLYRVFPKLGVTTRSQLRGALGGTSGSPS